MIGQEQFEKLFQILFYFIQEKFFKLFLPYRWSNYIKRHSGFQGKNVNKHFTIAVFLDTGLPDGSWQRAAWEIGMCRCIIVSNPINHVEEESLFSPASKNNTAPTCIYRELACRLYIYIVFIYMYFQAINTTFVNMHNIFVTDVES